MIKYNIDTSNLEKVRTKKLTFKGVTKDLPVYRIPISLLFYNDLNGRIATFISQYSAEGNDISQLDNEEYNNKIAEFIKDSSTEKRFKKTKDDIAANTQKEVGVVLTDGRIIDGNRRFTCLRELFTETGDSKYEYFEAVVLTAPSEDDINGWKAINSLELELQIGTDEKVDYSPIDWLVKVYHDLVKDHFYSDLEYSRLTKYSAAEINKMKVKAELMEDFLEFFNKPEQFYIAKRLELDGPLQELVKLRKKSSKQEWDEIKTPFYVYLWNATKGDKSRFVRQMVKAVGTEEFNQTLSRANEEAEKILGGSDNNDNSYKQPQQVNGEQQKQVSFEKQLEHVVHVNTTNNARNKPLTCCESALKSLSEIDSDIVSRWSDEETRNAYKKYLNDLEQLVDDLKKHVS